MAPFLGGGAGTRAANLIVEMESIAFVSMFWFGRGTQS